MSTSLDRGLKAFKKHIDAPIASFFSSCVHCGMCADACLFYQSTGDVRYTPINKVEPLRRAWKQDYTFWGRLAKRWKPVEREGPAAMVRSIPYRGLAGVVRTEAGILGIATMPDGEALVEALDALVQ